MFFFSNNVRWPWISDNASNFAMSFPIPFPKGFDHVTSGRWIRKHGSVCTCSIAQNHSEKIGEEKMGNWPPKINMGQPLGPTNTYQGLDQPDRTHRGLGKTWRCHGYQRTKGMAKDTAGTKHGWKRHFSFDINATRATWFLCHIHHEKNLLKPCLGLQRTAPANPQVIFRTEGVERIFTLIWAGPRSS